MIPANDDIVFIAMKRSPFTKAIKGGLSRCTPDYVLYENFKGLFKSINFDPNLIDCVILGNVCIPQGGMIEARMACLKAGIPVRIPVTTVNSQCSSGLEAIRMTADQLKNGMCTFAVAGGFEHMSLYTLRRKDINTILDKEEIDASYYHIDDQYRNDMSEDEIKSIEAKNISAYTYDKRINYFIKGCTLPMGITSENVANYYRLTREEVDDYAISSHQKSYNSLVQGLFNTEIVPMLVDGKVCDYDDGIREPNEDRIRSLMPVFTNSGLSTAANSSQLTDGSSLLLLTTRKTALKYNLKILGVYKDCVSIGCDPNMMGIAPVYAIQKLLVQNKLSINDVNLVEINEAFASQALVCGKLLEIPSYKYNKNGGALGIGHPLGATGGRLVMNILNTSTGGWCVVSCCAATGMGTAVLLFKE